ncbi:MAG: hypothetical protein A3H32_07740 [Betaproteobacteria bacterium RIFCSPLOWO2_02_FULL_63_19]|nr:MAG: hypothetical protein A3H32_07740 [Betaproteobacteria bacterium RIFCSPLOWO2_02_FULL_63_19]
MDKSATSESGIPASNSAKRSAAGAQLIKRTKIIVGVCAGILVLGGMVIAAMPDPGASRSATVAPRSTASASPVARASSGPLRASETNFNFGSISMAAGKVTHRYRFRNASTAPIVLDKMYTSCMCTTAALVKSSGRKFPPVGMPGHTPIPALNETLQPDEEAMVEVVFDPAAHGPAGIGPIDRVVTIEHNAGRPLELAFAANVTP